MCCNMTRGHGVPEHLQVAKKCSLKTGPPEPCSRRAPKKVDLLELERLAMAAPSPKHGWERGVHLLHLATLPTWLYGTETQVFQPGL